MTYLQLPNDFPVGDRVVVSGGRDYRDAQQIWCILTPLHQRHPIKILIEGGAKGADRLCRDWAVKHDVWVETYEADWTQYDWSAGPLRNYQMIAMGKPDLAVIFPGKDGTNNMFRQCIKNGVPVIDCRFEHVSLWVPCQCF
jgi:YspA, cpYpsA-related SLOG family